MEKLIATLQLELAKEGLTLVRIRSERGLRLWLKLKRLGKESR